MVKRIAEIRAWDRRKPVVLKGVSLDPLMVEQYTEEEIEMYRRDLIQQAEERLKDLRTRQEKRQGKSPVDENDLEGKFAQVLRAVQRKAKPSDWSYVPPEGNGARLLKILCPAP